ncbi:phage portal protein [Propylenella binzhouense]|uniref:Phage portal protein n=1 Tax=Propylenella binzhouense TaxID=2555902 RepID=A0A964T198_9HYPH|nr:phage portal protein [Propylenella binzhouense]MYZ46470.1 phage portal protein [Propylenella binzhouense]
MELFGVSPSIAGPSVNPTTAVRVPAVAAAVGLISSTCGTLPAKVFMRSEDGGKEPDPSHPAYALIHDDANDWTSAAQFREALTRDALLHGGGFAFANIVNGRVVELLRLDPTRVQVLADMATGEPVYRVTEGRGHRDLDRRTVLHLPAPGGVAPIATAREAIGLALTLEQHAARLFANGARPSGIVSFPGNLSAEGATRAKTAWQAAHGGDKSGSTAVLDGGASFQSLALTSVDAQFAEMRQFQLGEIARAFRVPPVFLADYSRATWGNSEEMGRQLVTYTLLPWLRAWEAAYRRVLLTPEERDTYSVEFVVDDLLRGDTKTRAEAYTKLRASGSVTANEVRRWENLPAHPDGDTLASPYTTSNTNTGAPADA